MSAAVINHVQTTASMWRTTIAFDLAPGVELHVEILDDGKDPEVTDAWIEPSSLLLEELTAPVRESLGCRSEGWPEWLEQGWRRTEEAA